MLLVISSIINIYFPMCNCYIYYYHLSITLVQDFVYWRYNCHVYTVALQLIHMYWLCVVPYKFMRPMTIHKYTTIFNNYLVLSMYLLRLFSISSYIVLVHILYQFIYCISSYILLVHIFYQFIYSISSYIRQTDHSYKTQNR